MFGQARGAKLVLGLMAVLVALLTVLSLFQLSAPGPAHRVLRRAVASLTEIDSLLAVHEPALREQAEASPDGAVSLPDYPLDVPLSAQEALRSTAEVKDLLLGRSADRVYQEGSAAFRDEGQPGGASRLSTEGLTRSGLGLLTASRHDAFRLATLALAVLCAALSSLLVTVNRGYRRLTMLGWAVGLGSLVFLLLTAAARLALSLADSVSSEYLAGQFLTLAKDAAWLPVWDGLAFAGLGMALVVLGSLGAGLSTDRRRLDA